jgi:hypothetical protein
MLRKLFLLFALLMGFMVSPCFAVEPYTYSSGLLNSPGVVGTSGASYAVTYVEIITDGTNAATATVYNGASSSGMAISQFVCPGASYFCGATFEIPVACPQGIYLSLSGTNAKAIIGYQPR